ncbi:hypothetical protein SAV31267_086040 [Streptomyces avermitilis]|uniref:Polyprenyl synthetase n=1 Tax=Streptomyces avermitilis TaxID=33903 RepID=A0A4D4N6H1_STRAX|nr:hypothetical protein SAV31267_086040 [Streptomyces avermitilis]
MHTFSLLHDDIMDGDAMRRGRPALWKAYGTGPAVLAGDALFALAVQTLTTASAPGAAHRLSAALGDLVRGQADDLLFAHRPWTGPEAVSVAEYEAMAEHKTGSLLGCALALGAHLAGAPEETAAVLDRTGRHLGVAFQIVDDLLGIWGDPAVTGKPVHGDLRQGKKTFPVLAALATPPAPRSRVSSRPATTPRWCGRRPLWNRRAGARPRCGRPAVISPWRTDSWPPSSRPRVPPPTCAPCSPPSAGARSDAGSPPVRP